MEKPGNAPGIPVLNPAEAAPLAPERPAMTLFRETADEFPMGAAAALGRSRGLLDLARAGELGSALRIYRPEPTVAFGQRDRFLPGFPAAVALSRAAGFTPVVRGLGGRAAAYHRGSLIIDHIEPSDAPVMETQGRFARFAELFVAALNSLGVDARVGPVEGEYCPGEFSVNGAGRIKLVGTAQRIVSRAWLFSSAVLIENSPPLRSVLDAVYPALGMDWRPETAGAVDDLAPGLTVDDVERAVLAQYAKTRTLRPPRLAPDTAARLDALTLQHAATHDIA